MSLNGVVCTKVAYVNIQRHGTLLRPGVHAQMRLRQQYCCRHATWPVCRRWKAVEQLAYRLQTLRIDSIYAMFSQARSVCQPGAFALAVVQIGGEVKALHRGCFGA